MNNTEFLKGISHELKFWKGFVKTERFLKGWVADVQTPELSKTVVNFIHENLIKGGKVLDLGSGVVSILNGTVRKDNLTACDPLGGLYEVIFDYQKHKINPPLPIPGEEMEFNEEFDIVHISNAIDHSQSPGLVFRKLNMACKKGGYIIIQGFENEATYENFEGFHQWDISIDKNDLMIKGRTSEERISPENFISLEKIEFEHKTWFVWIVRK